MQILIADDHALVRDGLKMLLQQLVVDSPLEFFEAVDYQQLDAQILAHPALDFAVIDLQMPHAQQGAGLEALSQRYPNLPLLVVSAFSSPDVVQKVLFLPNVYAFVPKGAGHQCVLEAVHACLQRRKAGVISDIQAAEFAPDSLGLAPRLIAVHALLRAGKSNKEIAYELNLSEGTVKNYMSDIFKQLKVVNRTQAAKFSDYAPL